MSPAQRRVAVAISLREVAAMVPETNAGAALEACAEALVFAVDDGGNHVAGVLANLLRRRRACFLLQSTADECAALDLAIEALS